MGVHSRERTAGRRVVATVLGAVLAGAVLGGVAVAAPADALPLPAAPAAPALPGAPAVPALPAVPGPPAIDPMNTGPALPALPALPSNPLDPVNGTPQTKDVTDDLGQVGEDGPEQAEQPAPEPAVLDGGTRIPGTPCSGDVSACVDLTTLRSWLIIDGEVRRGPVPVRVGDELGPTPVGRFAVQWKDIDHVSSELGTPMPYSVFFADGGIGFHEGPQDTDSAGCVKLSHDDAVAWYYALEVGDGVQVVRTSVR
ncbi:L,D-transpeptidase [Pseudonocardia sp.]|uniref:L,D-transpeptidase n=1 Tax=Pseudonocardia sp. TaxID=60912 RepID=UPI003D10337B